MGFEYAAALALAEDMRLTRVTEALRRGRPAVYVCSGMPGLPGAPLVIIFSASSWLMSCREGQLIRSHAGYAQPAAGKEPRKVLRCACSFRFCAITSITRVALISPVNLPVQLRCWQSCRPMADAYNKALGVVYGMMPYLALSSKAAYFGLQELCQSRNLLQRGI